LDEIISWLHDEADPIFAVNDHTTGMMTGTVQARKIDSAAARSGLSRDDYVALMESTWAKRDDVPIPSNAPPK
jgi:alpha-D-ribose 1-methylphosphonate 5-triphosphate diphosphatase